MPFETLTTQEIAAGKPVKQELFGKVKDNDDDHEERIQDLEASVGTEKPISFQVVGPGAIANGLIVDKLLNYIRVLAVKLYVPVVGISGTLQVDVEYKRGGGAWISILSAPIQVAYTAGDGAVGTSTVVVTDLDYNDQIRVNGEALQAECPGWYVKIEHEKRAA